MGNRDEIQTLLAAYLKNRTNRAGFDKLMTLLADLDDPEFRETVLRALDENTDGVASDFVQGRLDQLYPKLLDKIRETPPVADADANGWTPIVRRAWWTLPAVAASVLLLLWMGNPFHRNETPEKKVTPVTAEQIVGGKNRATLTLADGRTVELSDSQTGISVGAGIRYLDGTNVTNLASEDRTQSQLLTLSTPSGGLYQLALPDGSRVWLNAASSIVYPHTFSADKREVTLQGEAYFEVTKDRTKPFIVNTANQRVIVLGTTFNINAYDNEAATRTTLLTGSVRVRTALAGSETGPERMLKPNQQSVVGAVGSAIAVDEIDPYTAVAWKNGLFDFHGLTIDEAMKQIERWYNVRVIYDGPRPTDHLGGKMSRGVRLSTFLDFLKNDFAIQSELRPDRTLRLYGPKSRQDTD